METRKRCNWLGDDPLYVDYHDQEWGVPVFDDKALFEKLILDGFQAGLSWITILRKREHFLNAFDNFEPDVIASYGSEKIESLLQDSGIIRNRLKIECTISSAQAWQNLRLSGQEFSNFLWQFVGGKPIINSWETSEQVPSETNRFQLLWSDNLLCIHAGSGDGQ